MPIVRASGSNSEDVSPLYAEPFSVDGELTAGEPRIGLDSPEVSGNRRTVSSAISLNYDALDYDLEPGTLRSNEPLTFVGAESA